MNQSTPRATFIKLTAFLLAFFIVLTPLTPVFAQEADQSQGIEAELEPTPSDVFNEDSGSVEESDSSLNQEEDSNNEDMEESEEEVNPEPQSLLSGDDEISQNDKNEQKKFPQITESNGALNYEYPLNIPPGRNGLHPDLKLVYNSQAADEGTVFAAGWSVNIPYIERINREGTEKLYTENYYNSSLSGELFLITGSTWGSKVDNGEFLTYSLSSNVWTVKDKKGTVYKFGTNSAERQDNSGDIYKWMLQEVRDTNNNYIKYEYSKDNGQVYPYKITYTGNASTDGIFEIEFLKESRSDTNKSYKTAFLVTTNYRIYEIQAKISGTWVRKYALSYTAGDNGRRIILNTITETGKDESSSTVSMPAMDFDYNTTIPGGSWGTGPASGWSLPANLSQSIIADVNGDGLPDVMHSYDTGSTDYQTTYLNDGDGTWTTNSNYAPPTFFYEDVSLTNPRDLGVRAADVNGDGLTDLLQKSNYASQTWINNGNGWSTNSTWISPEEFADGQGSVIDAAHLADLNGDGLIDIMKTSSGIGGVTSYIYMNDGSGWTLDTNWTSSLDLKNGVFLLDINNDGLADLLQAFCNGLSCTVQRDARINNGVNGWTQDTNWNPPSGVGVFYTSGGGTDEGVRPIDFNGDNLPDLITSLDGPGAPDPRAFVNTGYGWSEVTTAWEADIPFGYTNSNADTGSRIADIDGDGMQDLVMKNSGTNEVYLNNSKRSDLAKRLTYPRGGYTDVSYQGSGKYASGLLNPNLPLILYTVDSVTNNDGLGTSSQVTYKYEGGLFNFVDSYDREVSGFSKVTKTTANSVTKTYLHQGNSSDSSNGEYSDHISKKGKPYRIEVLDTSSNIYSKVINKWDKYDLGNGRSFVKLIQKIDMDYDGDSDHKDKAEAYTYENTYGNLTQKIEYGEVSGSDNGTFTDSGTDDFTTDIAYALNSTDYIVGLPKTNTVTNNSSAKVRESKYYYDTQSHGTVTDGNLTKEEKWKVSSTYIDIEKSYNTTYGIVTQDKDGRDKTTDYTYDSYNLYPATITNHLDHEIAYTYDYSLGKPKQVTDANSRVFQTVYDGLDRVVEEKQPDLTTPSTLVTKTTYTYTSQTIGNKIQKTDHLDGSVTVDSYTYTDGFDRPSQIRKEMEDSNTFAVTDILYNNVEQIYKESIPYSSTGTSKTTATGTSDLLVTYSYDPLLRVASVVNAIGTTSNAYDDWKTSVTDPRSKVKHLYEDAYGNLVKVEEINSASTYTTLYEYNGNQNLTKITDALSNIRNFTYDGLGRRLTAEDLHASGDITFGMWTYTYDDANNLASVIDPNSQQIDYTYDDLNRKSTENFTGTGGTEVTYTYDSGTDGVGRLTSVAAPGASTAYVYNPHGKIKQETKTINATGYQTDTTFDRQSNILEITNPDSSKVKYTYNTAGQMETLQRKESSDGSFIDLITDFDYGPHGKIIRQYYANGKTTVNTYDSAKLYRLQRKVTANVDEVGASNQTLTVFAGSGDGNVRQHYSGGSGYSWSTITGSAGSHASDEDAGGPIIQFERGDNSNEWNRLDRSIFVFNTSALTSSASISAATLSVYGTSKSDSGGNTPNINIYSSNPASTSALAAGDFDSIGATPFADPISYSGWSTSGYNNFSFNSSGIAAISKTGVSKFGARNANYDVANSAPTWANGWASLYGRYSEETGTSNDPKLVITYDIAPGGLTNVLQDVNYTYDANGNVTQIIDSSSTSSSKTVNYVYDDLNRLSSATATSVAGGQSTYTRTYTYDAIGNITAGDAGNYTYAGDQGSNYANPHAVTGTSTGSKTYTYDNNGNLLTVTSGLSNTWDYNNRLTQAVLGGITSTYAYDHDGQRVKLDNGTTTTYYPSRFYNITGSDRVKHIFAGDQLVATVTGTGGSAAVYNLHTDHLSGSNVVTDSSGDQEELMDYFPYGGIRIDAKASSFGEQIKFAGYEHDGDSGLEYAGARYYKADLGRFISQDPEYWNIIIGINDPQLLNSYAYARNNPLAYNDPDGKWPTLAQANAFAARVDNYNPLSALFGGAADQISYGWQTGQPGQILQGAGTIAANTALVIGTALDLGLSGGSIYVAVQNNAALKSQVDSALRGNKSYQTYEKVNETGQVYVGRTSGIKAPEVNVRNRDYNHHMNEKGFGPAQLKYSTDNYQAIRGQEQIQIDSYRAIGNSANTINGISPNNPNLANYVQAAKKAFGIK